MTEKNKEFQELVDLFHEMRKNFPFRYLEFPKIVSKNRVDARIGNLMYQGQLIRDVKNSILRYGWNIIQWKTDQKNNMTAEEYDNIVRSYGLKRGPHATCGEDYYYLPKESYPDELFEYKGTRYILRAGGNGPGYVCLDPYIGSNNRIEDRHHGPIGADINMRYFKDITAEQVRKALDQFFAKLQKCIIISYSRRYRY